MDVYVGFFTEDWEGGRKSEKEREREREERKNRGKKGNRVFSLHRSIFSGGGG